MATQKRITLYYRVRKFRDRYYQYDLVKEGEHLTLSIEETKDGKILAKSEICDPEYSEKACLSFITILANTFTSPDFLQELYEENDLDLLP